MPNKGSEKSQKKKGSGAHRVPATAHTKLAVPTSKDKSEAGPPRLHAPLGSARSTSSLESGDRRLYVSPTVRGQHALGHRAVKPAQ
jgi:hypothetical protein